MVIAQAFARLDQRAVDQREGRETTRVASENRGERDARFVDGEKHRKHERRGLVRAVVGDDDRAAAPAKERGGVHRAEVDL